MALTQRKSQRKAGSKRTSPLPAIVSPAAKRRAEIAHNEILAAHDQHQKDMCRAVEALLNLPLEQRIVPRVLRQMGLGHLCRQTVWRRLIGQTRPALQAQEHGMLITWAAELVLCEWIKLRGHQGRPYFRKGIRARAMQLGGLPKLPGRTWMAGFERRHPDIFLGNGRGLDPRRAQGFNPTVVKNHFDEYAQAKNGVEDQDTYNVDEMGLQAGGGRKCLGRHAAFADGDTNRYVQRSDSLELTTIIDVVCADGSKLVPGFVFTGKNHYEEAWFDRDHVL
jgi:hypothetical protein